MKDLASLVAVAHILAWDYFSYNKLVTEKDLDVLYNMIDEKSSLLGLSYRLLSRHLSQGAKLYFKHLNQTSTIDG